MNMIQETIKQSWDNRGRARSKSFSPRGSGRDFASEGTSSTTSLQSHDEDMHSPQSTMISSISRENVVLQNSTEVLGAPFTSRSHHGSQVVDLRLKPFSFAGKLEARTAAQSRPKTLEEKKRESQQRKFNVLNSIGRFHPPSPEVTVKVTTSSLKQDPFLGLKGLESLDDEEAAADDSSISLTSLPPPDREERSLGNSASASNHASLDLSGHKGGHASLDLSGRAASISSSLNLSGGNMMNTSGELWASRSGLSVEEITTSATDGQWARFKLLGRIGLGNIQLSAKAQVLVQRNYDIMLNAIKQIYSLRDELQISDESSISGDRVLEIKTGNVLEEMQFTIDVPSIGAIMRRDPNSVTIEPEVQKQLHYYITVIASLYQDNSFHNYEHASNVLGAVDRLIGLVSLPKGGRDYRNLKYGYGVAREPWNHFALVFSAMIHDVDHNGKLTTPVAKEPFLFISVTDQFCFTGVPNAQLIKEKAHVAGAYKNKCVAEQNSIELAWNLLMEPCYRELREGIFKHRHELTSFRKLVVTAVMATDIADIELKALRKGRAEDAMKIQDDISDSGSDMELVSRKATFVMETLIQVADVSHTMGCFSTFKKWNHRLYREMYKAYRNGRAEQDPTLTWYKGEFGFFDYYIIPLAKKLNDCGIYGDSSLAYVHNAVENRRLWEEQGKSLVKGYIAEREAEEKSNQAARARARSDSSVSSDSSSDSRDIQAVDGKGASDTDSVSISSADSGDDSSHDNLRHDKYFLYDRRKVAARLEKVPSKASLMERGADSSDLSQSLHCRSTVSRFQRRSSMPGQTSSFDSPTRSSGSERTYRRVIFKGSQSSGSPGSATERSRSILKKKKPGEVSSPGSSSHSTDAVGTQENAPSRKSNRSSDRTKSSSITKEHLARSRSESPSAHEEGSGHRVSSRGYATTSPSTSPVMDRTVSKESSSSKQRRGSTSAGKVIRRGRRPSSRSRSPGCTPTTDDGSNDDGKESGKVTLRGKRPSATKT